MKPLDRLTNVERAKLLFELHPDMIPGFIAWAKVVTTDQLKDTTGLRKSWTNGMFSADYWISLIKDCNGIILKYGTQLGKSKNLFSDQLFDGYTAFITTTLLANYQKHSKNKKFTQTIDLLFT